MNNSEVLQIDTESGLINVNQSPHMQMIEMCINKGGDFNSLEKLMDLQERYEKAEAKKSYLSALSAFQSEVPTIQKKGEVDFNKTQYKFAKLEHVVETIKPFLSKYGLSFRHEQEQDGNSIKIICIINHKDGHQERMQLSSPPDSSGNKNGIQQIGSTVSYLKRYTLIGSLGLVVSDDDDDGQASGIDAGINYENKYNDLVKHNELVRKHFDEICGIKEAIQNDNQLEARGHFNDIEDEEERNTIWRAPTKGGVFTTKEREFLKEGKK